MPTTDYEGRPVLVTGSDGFIGSHLVERLAALGARVRAFCLYTSQGSCGWLDRAPEATRRKIEIVRGDVRDARFVEESCRGMDAVFHLAALIAIPYSYQAAESFVDTNVKGTLNVLEGARRAGVRRVVHTSTSEVYGTPETLPIRETHPLRAQSPYAASKIAADQMALAYHQSFGVPLVILRPFNTYGPRQSARAVLPTILLQLLDGRKEISLGRLDTKRDLTFVADTVEGFVRAGQVPGIEGRTLQLGTGRSVSVGDLLLAAGKAIGVAASARREEQRLRPDASEVLTLESDPSLARQVLDWTPTVTLEEGILRTAEWLRANRSLYPGDFLV